MNTIKIFLIKHIMILTILAMVLFTLPFQALAQAQNTASSSSPQCQSLIGGNINNLKDIIDWATCMIVVSVTPLLWVLSLVVFVYGVIQYFLNPNSVNEREKARKYIIWALIGMFVIFTVGGIIDLIRNTFGVSGTTLPLLPETQ